MKTVINDTTIHYEVNGTGTPMLIIHGLAQNIDSMQIPLMPILAAANIQQIYVELPGMGQSSGNIGVASSDAILALLQTFINQLIGDQPFYVVGHSYGGYLALGLIHDWPTRVLGAFLTCPVTIADTPDRHLAHHYVAIQTDFPVKYNEDAFADFKEMNVILNADAWTAYQQQVLPGLRQADDGFIHLLREHYRFSFEDSLLRTPFTGPVTLLLGRQDSTVGFQDQLPLLNSFSHLTLGLLDHAGHNLLQDQPKLFNDYWRHFLALIDNGAFKNMTDETRKRERTR